MHIANAQNYHINFTGIGASTTIDSIQVQNITQNSKITIAGIDNLYLGSVGINQANYEKNEIQVFPNPSKGYAELSFFTKKKDDFTIQIYDISGKSISNFALSLIQGNHRFKIEGLKQGIYLLQVQGSDCNYSRKLINLTTVDGFVKIEYQGNDLNIETNKLFKSSKSTVFMNYTSGDRLLFKGISGKYCTVVSDIPTSSKSINFDFQACEDADSNRYSIVKVGTIYWMAENLKTTKYLNGTPIPNVTNNSNWATLNTGAYCDFNNNPQISDTYGKLYNYYTITDSRKICPIGWRNPSDIDWSTLTQYLGGELIAGGKLKVTGTTHWSTPNTNATNEIGFSYLPSGARMYNGVYYNSLLYGYLWSSSEYDTSNAIYRLTHYNAANLSTYYYYKKNGFPTRCIKDELSIGQTYQGGIIAYNLQAGDSGYDANVPHGIIVTPNDISSGIEWYNGNYVNTGATGYNVGIGMTNTNTIIAIQGNGNYAAKLCSDLILSGYSDWCLPSVNELLMIYKSRLEIGGLLGNTYWSSTESDINGACMLATNYGIMFIGQKNNLCSVRAIRYF